MVNRYSVGGDRNDANGNLVKYTDYAELEFLRDTACKVMQEFADELDCKPDNEVILQAIDDLKSKVAELEKQRDALKNQLNRYFMSAGEADQRMNESRYVREALGFTADADNVSPRDLVEAIAEIGARAVDGFAKFYAEESQYLEPELMECATVYANKLRGGGV